MPAINGCPKPTTLALHRIERFGLWGLPESGLQRRERAGRPHRLKRGRNNRSTTKPQRSAAQSMGSTFGRMNPQPITPSTFTSAATVKAML